MTLLLLATLGFAADDDPALARRVDKVLARTPLFDGHNDTPWQFRERVDLQIDALPFGTGTAGLDQPMHTDIPRLRAGRAGAIFWSVWVPTRLPGPEAVLTTLEQIDVVHRMCERWPDDLALARTADEVVRIHKQGRIASLIGMEGGHSIGDSLPALRMMYEAGARYMTITHWRNTAWADAATDDPEHDGLTSFGEEVIREMNRLGMLIDLSHVSATTMHDVLDVTAAPVIFSHSGAMALNPHPRNVPDDVLDRLKDNGGVVMVDYLPDYVSAAVREHGAARAAEEARLESLHLGDPQGLEAAVKAWAAANPVPRTTLGQVADHIDHIRDRIGADHVGLGSDFDGMDDQPDGLDDVSKVPDLLVELLRRGYSDAEITAIAGANTLRVLRAAEATAARVQRERMASTLRLAPAKQDEEDGGR